MREVIQARNKRLFGIILITAVLSNLPAHASSVAGASGLLSHSETIYKSSAPNGVSFSLSYNAHSLPTPWHSNYDIGVAQGTLADFSTAGQQNTNNWVLIAANDWYNSVVMAKYIGSTFGSGQAYIPNMMTPGTGANISWIQANMAPRVVMSYRKSPAPVSYNCSAATTTTTCRPVKAKFGQIANLPLSSTGSAVPVSLQTNDGLTYAYNSNNQLISIKTRTGVTQTISYSNNLISQVSDSYGRSISFAYTLVPASPSPIYKLTSVTMPGSKVATLAYTPVTAPGVGGQLASITYPNGTTRQFTYGDSANPNQITQITNQLGNPEAYFSYDASGRVIDRHGLNNVRHFSFAYTTLTSPTRQQVSITNVSTGHVVTKTYAPFLDGWQLSRTQDSLSGTSGLRAATRTWDALGATASVTDYRGVTTTYTNDPVTGLNLTTIQDAAGLRKTTTRTWNSACSGAVATVTEPNNRQTLYTYDANCNRLTKTLKDTSTGLTQVWTTTYDALGFPLTVDGPRTDVADVTTYTYSPSNHTLLSVKDALGKVTTYSNYSPDGVALTTTMANGIAINNTLDTMGQVVASNVGGLSTGYSFDADGNLVTITGAGGVTVNNTFDGNDRIVKSSLPIGHMTTTYDANSHVTQTQIIDGP